MLLLCINSVVYGPSIDDMQRITIHSRNSWYDSDVFLYITYTVLAELYFKTKLLFYEFIIEWTDPKNTHLSNLVTSYHLTCWGCKLNLGCTGERHQPLCQLGLNSYLTVNVKITSCSYAFISLHYLKLHFGTNIFVQIASLLTSCCI